MSRCRGVEVARCRGGDLALGRCGDRACGCRAPAPSTVSRKQRLCRTASHGAQPHRSAGKRRMDYSEDAALCVFSRPPRWGDRFATGVCDGDHPLACCRLCRGDARFCHVGAGRACGRSLAPDRLAGVDATAVTASPGRPARHCAYPLLARPERHSGFAAPIVLRDIGPAWPPPRELSRTARS